VTDVAAAREFVTRLLRLDGAAVVRLRPSGAGAVDAWARLPFGALVTRPLRVAVSRDVTLRAAEFLAAVEVGGALPEAVDHAWRWSLPPGPGEVVEELAAADVRRVAEAAAETARHALTQGVGGRAVGSRRIRDALLDHVPFVVDTGAERIEIPQRLVQALVRMGLLGTGMVAVRRVGPWKGLSSELGAVWYRPVGETLALQVAPYRPKG
jgi:hypothetical protein